MLNQRQLEAFRAVMEAGSVTAASKVLFVSQPSISRLIADLESQLDIRLFEREGRKLLPTPEARSFFEQVERSFVGLKELQKSASEIRRMRNQQFTIGASPGTALEFVPALVADFQQQHTDVCITTHVTDSDRMLAFFRSGFVSVALMSPIEKPPSSSIFYQRSFDYVLLLPTGHPLAQSGEPVDLSQIRPGQLICPMLDYLARKCPSEAQFRIIQERVGAIVEISFAAAAMVRHGLGVALIDPFTARFFLSNPAYTVKPVVQPPVYDLVLTHSSLANSSPIIMDFMQQLVKKLAALSRL